MAANAEEPSPKKVKQLGSFFQGKIGAASFSAKT
jgi:hypothetical protein